ncbi:unnamed protein product [Anisakis simplex]|uniref:PPPDE domain-containing protein n=1 Tax=Anisakis simplex TaxID=6269 RepID=A0A0M3KB36_ANISI|nr:unnamed protein product [Anisakis simplex]
MLIERSLQIGYGHQMIGYGHQMVLEDLSNDTTIFSLKIGWLPVGLGERLYYGCFSSPSSQSYSPARLHFLTDMAAIHCSCMDPSDFDFVEMNGKV